MATASGKAESVHDSSMAAVGSFVEQWLEQRSDEHLLIVDHGFFDVNGSY